VFFPVDALSQERGNGIIRSREQAAESIIIIAHD
jgi:hypothetical protein